MGAFDTPPGPAFYSFPTTIWSQVLAAGDVSSARQAELLGKLLQTYWKPVFAYIHTAWHKSPEDAKDLTQAFFAYLLEKGYLSHLRPERGSFRGYLKRALKSFLINAEEAAHVRRHIKPLFSLDASPEEMRSLGPAAPGETAEEVYDRQWFRTLLDSSIEALRESLKHQGKEVYFEVLRLYAIEPGSGPKPDERSVISDEVPAAAPTYQQVAQSLNLRESDVRNYLTFCRVALRRILKVKIREYVESEEDVERELQALLDR